MTYSIELFKKLEKLDPSIRNVLYEILQELQQNVTKDEFNDLKEIVKELSNNVKELSEAQKKTEQRLNELAEAQKKTEQRLNELAEAQKKTEQRLNELAEAQKETEKELKKLIGEHRKTREHLGGLSHSVGYILEDRAYKGLPPLLERDFRIKIIEPLKRQFIEITENNYEEINIIGRGKVDTREVLIIGEAKTQLKKRDVDNFLRKMDKLKYLLPEEKIVIFVTYQTSPKVEKYLKNKGLKIYYSYEFPI